MRARFVLAATLAFASLSGCVSRMTVRSVAANPRARGFRYFLPKPFLLVTPKVDGTVTLEKVYLPDPANEYAIDASSFVSTYKLSVEIDGHGLLKKVVWNTGSAESTKAALETVASLWKARTDAEAARTKAEAERAGGDDSSAAVAKAGRGQATSGSEVGESGPPRTEPGSNGSDRVQLEAWGPVLFEVVDTPDKVTLRPVNAQARMPTSKK